MTQSQPSAENPDRLIITRIGLETAFGERGEPPLRSQIDFCRKWIQANCKSIDRFNRNNW